MNPSKPQIPGGPRRFFADNYRSTGAQLNQVKARWKVDGDADRAP